METRTGIYVTVIAMKKYPNSEKIQVGTMVDLVKEPTNTHDNEAIAVELDGIHAGYIANSVGKTVLGEGISASEANKKFKEVAKAEILSFAEKRGAMSFFNAELILTEETVKKPIRELNFRLVGGFTTYPAKGDLVSDLLKSSPRKIKLTLYNQNIIGEYNGKPAGMIKDSVENLEIIQQYIEDSPEVIAEAMSSDRGDVLCNLKLNSVVKTNRVALEEVLDNIILKGINTKAEIDEKLEYLRNCNVSDIAVISLFESYVEYPEHVKNRIPKRPKVVYVDTSGIVDDAICYMNIGSNLLFEGDKGVGKNVLTETLAWLFNRPQYEFSGNSQHSNNSLLGSHTFNNPKLDSEEDKKETVKSFLSLTKIIKGIFFKGDVEETELNGMQKFLYKFLFKSDKELVFEMSSILEAFTNGGIIVLDEFNTNLAHVIPIFNALLDDRRSMEVTGLGLIKGHKNFCAIATQNRDYEGTFEGNEATLDRFEPILFPPLNSISGVLMERIPTISYETISVANRLYLTIKSSVEAGQISDQALSIRGFISACKVMEQGKPLKEALIKSVANRITDIDDRRAVINIIDLQLGN